MPVVTRADCTQIDINEKATFTFSDKNGLTAEYRTLDINFNACQGANNNNNDLKAHVKRLANQKKISIETRDEVDKIVVGKTYCREAIDSFLDEEGLMGKPACKYSSPQECGCKEVQQNDYRGTISKTASGKKCQRWDSQSPQAHTRTRENFSDANLVENYCRNPDGEPGGAWCYTTDPNSRWEYCGVEVCGFNQELTQFCSYEDNQADYRGTIAVTEGGLTCQKWTKQSPHTHTRTPEQYPDKGLGNHNYCRNPDNEDRAWCYTTDPGKRWDFCDVPKCPGSESARRLSKESTNVEETKGNLRGKH
mmetsp:Transcript_14151/g.20727  ORF Transcript_14151/g.20727 Transcript_14151/m.20727 type:complete len:307 (-) Transcript_14151:600-1520(-)